MIKFFKFFTFLLVFALSFYLLNKIFEPKYKTSLLEGSMTSDYYKSLKNHEVIFIGDCEVYANFSPLEMYQNYGITAYVRGNSQQLIWQSYGILKETLKYEIPKVVVLNIASLKTSEPEKEPYNRLMLDKMKWSKEKVEIIKASMLDSENFLDYVFPILRYHSRYNELTFDDIKYLFIDEPVTYEGYLLNKEIKPYTNLPVKRRLPNYEFKDNVIDYLDKIRELCNENNIELVLIKAPSLYPYWYDEYEEQVQSYANKYNLKYFNLINDIEEIGLDFSTDTYDGGLHLNYYGAKKLSNYFGKILRDNFTLTDYRYNLEVNDIYTKKLIDYNNAIRSDN